MEEDPAVGLARSSPVRVEEAPRVLPRLSEDLELPEELQVASLLRLVMERGGSDLHITGGSPPVIRVNGSLSRLANYPVLNPVTLRQMIYSILTQRQRERFEENLELDLSFTLVGEARFRVNVYQQRESLGAAFRLIPITIRSLEELGLPEQVRKFADLPRGLVLVTGPTGNGKSTTLAALIEVINANRELHIMTVEDPIEFLHNHNKSLVNQREVGTDTKSFSGALRHVLRQDPDVILVGEMRDLETISTALTAAETGHLVLATLHTQDVPQTVDRVIDVFPPHQQQQVRVQLAGSIQGIITQQLLPTRDGRGRTVAVEVLMATPAVRHLIRDAKSHQLYSVIQAGGAYGMQTMDQSLAGLVKRGRITADIAFERCHDQENLKTMLGR